MKKILCIIAVALMGMAATFGQTVTLTFTCQNSDGGYLQPDSIIIENLTRNWSETIYYPDTVYTLNVGTSVPNYPNDNGMQVMPNPFDGSTRVNIQSSKTENVRMKITDMSGRVCAEYNGVLQEGSNLFSISLTTPQTYVLSVHTSSGIRSLKMENTGRAGANRIAYEGATVDKMPVVQLKSSSSHAFELGDEMRYRGHSFSKVSSEVRKEQTTDDNITLVFDTHGIACTGIPTVTDFDGNVYNTVQLGNQCWMRENMRTTHFPNGSEIPLAEEANSSSACRYIAVADSINIEGYLYNWLAAMNGANSSTANPSGIQGICPEGWHVPSDLEWIEMTNYVGQQSEYVCGDHFYGKSLAFQEGWTPHTSSCAVGNNQSSNNATGFSARPVGYFTSSYSGRSKYSHFWSSSEYGSSSANYKELNYANWYILDRTGDKGRGASVRCIMNDGRATVSTDAIIIQSDSTVLISGTVLSDVENTVTTRGVCWDIYVNPNLEDQHSNEGSGTGIFSSTVGGLSLGISYHARAYAVNSAGISYGNDVIFAIPNFSDAQPCSGAATVTDLDGNEYSTVQIGSQCWMAENLRATHYYDGMNISHHTPNQSLISSYGLYYDSWAVTRNSSNNSSSLVGLQGVCPLGWHVPSNSEWNQLINYAKSMSQYNCDNNSDYVAKALAGNTGWNTSDVTCAVGNDLSSNNILGFGAVPAGYWSSSYVQHGGENSYFWSATINNGSRSSVVMGYNVATIYISPNNAGISSVRCIRDISNTDYNWQPQPCPNATTVTDVDGNIYNTLQMGSQCWMAENLRTTHYADNTIIDNGNGLATSNTSGYYYQPTTSQVPNYNLSTYGLYYNWAAVMHGASASTTNPSDVQGICPTGWHVPNIAEWNHLFDFVGEYRQFQCAEDSNGIAKAMCSTSDWETSTMGCAVGNNPLYNNTTGFNILPTGYYSGGNTYNLVGSAAIFSATSQYNDTGFLYDASGADFSNYYMPIGPESGLPVRCIKD